jgi:hypothetical protein
MAKRPTRRTESLVIEQAGPDTLVYDERTHRAFCLDARAARVWDLCDGQRTEDEITEAYGEGLAAGSIVSWTVNALEQAGLLEARGSTPRAALSRRTLIRDVGLAAIPIIMGITAPRARAAHSCASIGQSCNNTGDCCPMLHCEPRPGPGVCQ